MNINTFVLCSTQDSNEILRELGAFMNTLVSVFVSPGALKTGLMKRNENPLKKTNNIFFGKFEGNNQHWQLVIHAQTNAYK